MKKMLYLSLLLISTIGLQACEGGDREDLKSPCVGAEGSPCDNLKRSVNGWWLA
jgi:hypothetical protein